MRGRGGCAVDPDRDQSLADEPAERRPLLERRIGFGDPQGLEQEAGDAEEEKRADEDPVADLVTPALVPAGDAVDPVVVEPGRLAAALHRQDHETDDEQSTEDVEEQRVAEVEGSMPEVPAEHGLREVVLEREDPGPDEEHDEAVEDHRVREPGNSVTALDPRVRQHDPRRTGGPVQRPVGREAPPPATVLAGESDDAPREDRRRDDDQCIPEPDLPVG